MDINISIRPRLIPDREERGSDFTSKQERFRQSRNGFTNRGYSARSIFCIAAESAKRCAKPTRKGDRIIEK